MDRPTRVHLLRHGPTEWNQIRRFQGRSDLPLSEQGRAMAEQVALALAGEEWDAVYSSPLKRAMETAKIVVGSRDVEVGQVEGLQEMDLGELEGKTLEDLSESQLAVLAAWREHPSSVEMPGGEGLQAVQARAVESVNPLVAAHRGQKILVVGHAFNLLTYICAAIEIDLDRLRSLFLDPLGLTTLEAHPDRILLRCFNHVPGRWTPT